MNNTENIDDTENTSNNIAESMKSRIHDVVCKKKAFSLDGKPYRLEIWGPTFPIYFTSFDTENDCMHTRKLIFKFIDFMSKNSE